MTFELNSLGHSESMIVSLVARRCKRTRLIRVPTYSSRVATLVF